MTWPAFTDARRSYIRFATALPGDRAVADGLRRDACDLFATTLPR